MKCGKLSPEAIIGLHKELGHLGTRALYNWHEKRNLKLPGKRSGKLCKAAGLLTV